jgi:hypothetical protein
MFPFALEIILRRYYIGISWRKQFSVKSKLHFEQVLLDLVYSAQLCGERAVVYV